MYKCQAYLSVWYGDENAIVRNKLYQARVKRLTPWLEEIIQQGAREGVFTTPYPDQAARIVISLLEDVGYASTELLTASKLSPEDLLRLQWILLATTDALERLLGAPSGCLQPASYQLAFRLTIWFWLPGPSATYERLPL